MIMKEKLAFWAPAVPALILFICGIVLLFTDGLPFARLMLGNKQKDIDDLQQTLQYTQSDIELFRQDLAGLEEIRSTAISLPLKNAENLFREQVSGLQIKNIGQVRSTRINEEITIFEVKFHASGTIAEITDFLANAASGTPRLYWRSLYIEPDNSLSPEHVTLNGTITAFNFIPDAAEREVEAVP